jgi:hypothetical protein
MSVDPVIACPDLYRVVFENERVRVLEYRDVPGDRTAPHHHPDTVMYTLGSFQRRITAGDRHVDVDLEVGQVRWVAAQDHAGENIGTTPSHAIFVELKETDGVSQPAASLGPQPPQT